MHRRRQANTATSSDGESPAERLAPYRAKRDFELTAESSVPTGGPPAPNGWRFVVQRHRAWALHDDLRLAPAGRWVVRAHRDAP